MTAASPELPKIIDRFFEIVEEWKVVTQDDAAANKQLAPAWELVQMFPDRMSDYGLWVDELRVALSTDRVLGFIVPVPHTSGRTEPFVVLLDLDNARVFMMAARIKFQISVDFYNSTRDVGTEEELREIFEQACFEAIRRAGIVLNSTSDMLNVPTFNWGDSPRLVSMFRPMAFYSDNPAAVAFIDVLALQSSDYAWYNHIRTLCIAYQSAEGKEIMDVHGQMVPPQEAKLLNAEAQAVIDTAQPPPAPRAKVKAAPKNKKPATKAASKPKKKTATKVKGAKK